VCHSPSGIKTVPPPAAAHASTATSSAFVQQRKKILPLALEKLFLDFVSQTSQNDTYKGYRLLAVDGGPMPRKNTN